MKAKQFKHGFFMLLILSFLMVSFNGCSKDDDDSDISQTLEPLNWLEEEAAHKWSRYHGYDDSTQYYILFGDRTACYFEITSSGSRTDNECYTNWSIDEKDTRTIEGEIAYKLIFDGYSINYFSFVKNKIYVGGYDNLDMFPSSTSRGCECD